jgi:hypothetical protein
VQQAGAANTSLATRQLQQMALFLLLLLLLLEGKVITHDSCCSNSQAHTHTTPGASTHLRPNNLGVLKHLKLIHRLCCSHTR